MRLAKTMKNVKLLDEKEYFLSNEMIVIADDKESSWNWWSNGRT